jgi:hypothetical protein
MRNSIFISHASPDDNDFTKWLALKLIGLGYEVWCDILFLDKGADFWIRIEKEIRDNSFKFLVVSSTYSNQREGVLKELAVAAKVKKVAKDENFIIPLAIDDNLSYDDINIDIVRLNAIDFKISWAIGLQDLIEALEKQKTPKNSPDPSKANLLYQQIFLHNKGVIAKDEIYDSNWFPILSFPEYLKFHDFERYIPKGFDIRELTYPAISFKNYLCTFAWEYDFMQQLPKTETYNKKTVNIPISEVLSGEYNTEFISNAECQRLIVQIINKSFEVQMNEKGLRKYQMSNSIGYWIEKGKLEKDKFNKIQLVGKLKEKNWHYGISGAGKLYPFNVLMISSRIFFTIDGINLIESKSIQHSARRKQGKNWWNDAWRSKLLAFIKYLSDDEISFFLKVGSEEYIRISNEPYKFIGKVSYNIPYENNLEEETELYDLNDLDKSDEESVDLIETE